MCVDMDTQLNVQSSEQLVLCVLHPIIWYGCMKAVSVTSQNTMHKKGQENEVHSGHLYSNIKISDSESFLRQTTTHAATDF